MRTKDARGAGWVLVALSLSACGQPAPSVPPPAAPHWTYGQEHGPAEWPSLDPAFAACGAGQRQSPIDITDASNARLPGLATSFAPAELKIIHHEHVADGINNGHTIQVNYEGADTLTIGGERFDLQQYHFHAPSEHTVKGRHFPMEMHLVHKSAAGRLAVVGVFIEEGPSNAAFEPVWANLPAVKGKEFHLEHVEVDVDALLPKARTTYRYEGSLTTPPCTEGVQWLVMTNPIRLSPGQIEAFTAIVKDNNRPVQPLRDRAVVTDRVTEKAG